MKTIRNLLKEFEACLEAMHWVKEKTIEEIVEKCDRGDWLFWLAKKINLPIKTLTLAGALCSKTVIHLIKEKCIIDAILIAEQLGSSEEVSLDDLNTVDRLYCNASYASCVAYSAAYAEAYGNHISNKCSIAMIASNKSKNETADICREIFGKELIEAVNNILKN
jgi:hypothetical protein